MVKILDVGVALAILALAGEVEAAAQFVPEPVDPIWVKSEADSIYRVDGQRVKARTLAPLTSFIYYHREREFDSDRIVEDSTSCELISDKQDVEFTLEYQALATACPGKRPMACSQPSVLQQGSKRFWTVDRHDFSINQYLIGSSFPYHPQDSVLAEVPPGCCLALQVTAIPVGSEKIKRLGFACETHNDVPWWWWEE